jgi:PrtD family type I secretion system ABC transporter
MIAGSIIMGRALAPVEAAIGHWRSFTAARGAYGRLTEMLVANPFGAPRMSLPAPAGALEVAAVTARPQGAKAPVLQGIGFALQPGELLGVIGPSGAGKSSLARLLVGVWPPLAGSVRLDGAEIGDWNRREIGPHIGYLPQDVELFSGTVAENIARFGEPDPEGVVKAAQLAGAHDLILHFADGYDTQIGEGGGVLSGGQRQRIGLARAVYGEPALIVLDEPNSNLDSEGEEALRQALRRLGAMDKTVVIISHRPSVLSVVDKLLVLRDGRAEAFGPRDEVMRQVTRAVAEAAGQSRGDPAARPPSVAHVDRESHGAA